MNPYSGQDFFGFFATLWQRLSGSCPLASLASDEVQLLVLCGVAASSALIGTYLTLKRMTMLANSLSHTILIGIVGAHLLTFTTELMAPSLSILFLAAFLTALLTAMLTQFLCSAMKLQEDASIGLVFTSLFALGIVLITAFTRDAHIGLEAVLGNADALHPDDLISVYAALSVDFLAVALFFKEFKIAVFDPQLASILKLRPGFFNYLLMLLCALTAISAFRAVGVILVLAFLVAPVLTARVWTHRLKILLTLSALIGVLCSIAGVALSRHLLSVFQLPLSTGGLVVSLLGLAFVLSLTFRSLKGLMPFTRNKVTIDVVK